MFSEIIDDVSLSPVASFSRPFFSPEINVVLSGVALDRFKADLVPSGSSEGRGFDESLQTEDDSRD